jgi:exonuclease SbcC
MLITRVELENIKSYQHLTLELQRGTTAIQGANGSGKTTLVEAIGFALFDALPYKHQQFVREGEKYGRIAVHLIGNDERRYVVERRCGAGAYWQIYDCEADYRLEQRTDVLDKLHDLFGIERERPLETLFHDALGVPQGTFTSIFLEPASRRKKTFDELLQIEDYKTASDYLLEVQRCYKDQMLRQQQEIQRLQFETRDLAQRREELQRLHQEEEQHVQRIATSSKRLAELEERYAALQRQREELLQLRHRYEQGQLQHEEARRRLSQCEQELAMARQARAAIEASRADYLTYQEAGAALKELRQSEQQRNRLHQQQAGLQSRLAAIRATIEKISSDLEAIAQARQQIVELAPQADQQRTLERRLDELKQQTRRYDELIEEGKALRRQQEEQTLELEQMQRRIAEIEPLQATAALLAERIATLTRLQARLNERSQKQQQLQEKRELWQQREEERQKLSQRLRFLEETIAGIEAHREEVAALPALRAEYEQLAARRYRLEGNIDGYQRSRQLSRGGRCPLLHEPCLNIKQKGLTSLESYFDALIEQEQAQLTAVSEDQRRLQERIDLLATYEQEYERLGQYKAQYDECADRLRQLAGERRRLARDIEGLEQDLEELKDLGRQIAEAERARHESEVADRQLRELERLRALVQQRQTMLRQIEEQLLEKRRAVQELRGCKEELRQAEEALAALNDPAGRIRTLLAAIEREAQQRAQLAEQEQQRLALEQELQALAGQLAAYSDLDERIAAEENRLQRAQAGYQRYLAHEQLAQQYPQRQQARDQAAAELLALQEALRQAETSYRRAAIAFDEAEYLRTDEELQKLRAALQRYDTALQHIRQRMGELAEHIRRAEALLLELETAQREHRTLEDLQNLIDYFRRLLKEAAPAILRARLADISAEANRIFGEIMGDRSSQLLWQDDYEILLRNKSALRTFAQLSGGEQMSAALAVRLALLKKLSNLNIAFFDEPTQNMDLTRRANLAEQIRRVRGFDQLIVISHDDTFEQGLDSLIRLHKENGATRLISEHEWSLIVPQEEHVHAT